MFTGIVQQVGHLKGRARISGGWSLTIGYAPWTDAEALVIGESVAVQGACLTIARLDAGAFGADLLDETTERSTLGVLSLGSAVNLERALRPTDRLGGHIVSGHVDERGAIAAIRSAGRDRVVRVQVSPTAARQTILKGSVALDGISLTVSALGDDWLEVSIIPHTWAATSLAQRQVGDPVNIETDVLGKHVARLLGTNAVVSTLTLETLARAGFV